MSRLKEYVLSLKPELEKKQSDILGILEVIKAKTQDAQLMEKKLTLEKADAQLTEQQVKFLK